jgi:hypothetical protein
MFGLWRPSHPGGACRSEAGQLAQQQIRHGHTGAVIPILRASLAVAFAVGVLAACGCSFSSSGCPPGAPCPAAAPTVAFSTTINGKSAALPTDGHVPSYRVRPGEYLVIRVVVTVPSHVRVTALWFGISKGTWGNGPEGPIGMNPILAHYRQPLSAGSHTFGLRWRLPPRHSGASLYLVTAWSSHQPSADVAQAITTLILT